MKVTEEKVYIILLNHKGWKDSIECLESILKLKYHNFQVIVVDNSPTSESVSSIKSWATNPDFKKIPTAFPEIVYPLLPKPLDYRIISESESKNKFYEEPLLIIKAEKNRGFSAGNNIAIDYALRREDFDYCWLLNNDTVVEKDSLRNQIKHIKGNNSSKTGILGSKLIYYNQPEKIQAIGGAFNSILYVSKHIGEGANVNSEKEEFGNIDYIVGASMFVPVNFIKDVGSLCEDYFLYYEELDWAYRGKLKGWKIDWCENSIVYHKEGASIGSSSNPKERTYFSEINIFKSRKIFFKKFKKVSFMFWVSSILIILNRVKRFQFKLAYEFLKISIN